MLFWTQAEQQNGCNNLITIHQKQSLGVGKIFVLSLHEQNLAYVYDSNNTDNQLDATITAY